MIGAIVALFLNPEARGSLATVWHIPDNHTGLGVNLRHPEFEIGTNTTGTLCSGFWIQLFP
ncbi:MAG TPA: hypothetical protein VNN22_04625 [Verrucomicrobiae bacterium]|nr:hypothetical protein [Verrucomicrobiae bacterium]